MGGSGRPVPHPAPERGACLADLGRL